MDADEQEFSLLMPFVSTASNGGPHDDNSYVAGWEMGALDASLRACSLLGATPRPMTMRLDNQAQIDLIAMRHGYEARVTPCDGFWIAVEFKRTGGAA